MTIKRSRAEIEAAWSRMRDEKPNDHGELELSDAPGGRGMEARVHHPRGDGRRHEAKLRRLKQLAEIGEIVHSDATVHRGPHPAQPSSKAPNFEASAREVLR